MPPNSPSPAIVSTSEDAFLGLDAPSLDELRQVGIQREYPGDIILCRQGAREHTFYVVIAGQVAITMRQENGSERLINICGPGQYFGEMALLDDSPRVANCTTLVPTTVLEITEERFEAIVERHPTIAYNLMRRVLSNLRTMDRNAIEDLAKKNEQLQEAYDDLKLAQDKLVEKQKLERELEIAAQVQRSLLRETLPKFPDYRFAAYLEPARAVGGDLYDVMVLDDDHVGLLLADVADKSVQAALFMAVIKTLFLVESRLSLSPSEVALRVHQDLMEVSTTDDVFVTVFYGILHRPTGRLTYVVAGHERPLLVRPNQDVMALSGKGRFLGMLEDLQLDEYVTTLQPGDRLVMFSDGVPDAINVRHEIYGVGRLRELLQKRGNAAASTLIQHITQDIALWTHGVLPFDDLTLLCVEALVPGEN
jgi:sigma-B regulation protein RsbU (phosphoserine phosphatase)